MAAQGASPPRAQQPQRRISLVGDDYERENTLVLRTHSNMLSERMAVRTQQIQTHDEAVQGEDLVTSADLELLSREFERHGRVLTRAQFTATLQPRISNMSVIETLFDKMDSNQSGVVDWDEFCTYMVHDLQSKDSLRTNSSAPLLLCARLFDSNHRGTILKIENMGAKLVSVSDEGTICFWNTKMEVIRYIPEQQ